MPVKSLRPCNKIGCGKLTRDSYCDEHKRDVKKDIDRYRGNANQRGYGYKWQKARAEYLKLNPLCQHCLTEDKRVTPALVVDHIIPHKGDMKLFWDTNNWQPLCKLHHDRKTASEAGTFGR